MGRRIGLACMAASAPDGPPLVMSGQTRIAEPLFEATEVGKKLAFKITARRKILPLELRRCCIQRQSC